MTVGLWFHKPGQFDVYLTELVVENSTEKVFESPIGEGMNKYSHISCIHLVVKQ